MHEQNKKHNELPTFVSVVNQKGLIITNNHVISEADEIISEAAPNECQPGSTTTNLPVFKTDLFIVLLSRGDSVLGSITSTLIPCFSKALAAFKASITIQPIATNVTFLPCFLTKCLLDICLGNFFLMFQLL